MFRTLARCSAVQVCKHCSRRLIPSRAHTHTHTHTHTRQARCFSATPVKFEVFFTKSHEWVDFKGDGTATTGITQFAQEGLGEVVFIDLPEVGDNFEAGMWRASHHITSHQHTTPHHTTSLPSTGDEYGTVESVKTTSPLITPTSGTVQAVNAALTDDTSMQRTRTRNPPRHTTGLVNESPEVEAWMIKLEKAEQSADNELMNREQYEEYLASDECNEH